MAMEVNLTDAQHADKIRHAAEALNAVIMEACRAGTKESSPQRRGSK